MQPVCRREVTRPPASGVNAVGVLTDPTDLVMGDLDAGLTRGVEKCAAQYCTAHTAPGATLEFRVDAPRTVPVADTPDRLAERMYRETLKVAQGMGHQAFTARLVDRSATAFGDNHVQPRTGTMDRSSQTGGPTADDQKVDHVRLASAAFSTLTRVLSNHALRIEKASAVTHAACTNGSATPSAITAT